MAKSLIRLDIESREYEAKLKKSRRQFEDFTASIGINMKKLTAYGIAAGAASAAINKLTQNVSQCIGESIEMAKAGEGIRLAFDRLNRPDLLAKLREATHETVSDLELMKQAVKFKDFRLDLEQLGAMLAFAQKKASDTGQSVDFLVESIVNGLGRQSKLILDNLGISASEIDEEMKKTGDMTQAVGNIIKKQMSEAGEYVETAATRAAQADAKLKNAMEDLGRTMMPLAEAASTFWTNLTAGALELLNTGLKPIIEAYTEIGRLNGAYNAQGGDTKVDRMISRLGTGKGPGAYKIYKEQLEKFDEYINKKKFEIAAFGGDRSAVAQSAKAKLQKELDGALKMREEYVRRAQELHNRVPSPAQPAPSDGGKSKKTSTSKTPDYRSSLANVIAKSGVMAESMSPEDVIGPSAAWTAYTQSIAKDFETPLSPLKRLKEELELMREELENAPDTESYQAGLKGIAEKEKEIAAFTGQTDTSDIADDSARSWRAASAAMSSVGNALNQIEDPAAKIMGVIGMAIANIAAGFAEASSKEGKGGVWYWIAATAAGLATMLSTISTIKSAASYAGGGIIPGNSYSGDNQVANVNAGELILNRAQQGNLASQFSDENRGLRVLGEISGEKIILVANRTFKRRGEGEIVTW